MQAADYVELGDRFTISGRRGLESFVERHRVWARRIFPAPEGTESTGSHAHVRGINVAIDVEICLIAMHTLAHVVGHPANGENIAGAVERNSVSKIETVAGHHLG